MGVDLDSMLDLSSAAAWLGLSERALLAKCKGRKASIPAVWINRRVVRFHPRTIIAKFAAAAGVAPREIAAMWPLAGKEQGAEGGSENLRGAQ